LALFAVSIFFTSCEQEQNIAPSKDKLGTKHESQFKKEITLTDLNRKNTVVLLVSSDNKEILDLYDSKSLSIEPVFDKPTSTIEQEFEPGLESD